MENLFCNLSEEEFSKSRKILLWCFSALFIFAGCYVLFVSLILGEKSISPVLCIAPFGIGIVVGGIAAFDSFKGTDLFFLVDNDKIEYKFGIFRPVTHYFNWTDVKEFVIPKRQKKVKIICKDGTSYVINLTWVQKTKSSLIMKSLYHGAKEKDINVRRVLTLGSKGA
jgi:hypothetical protein